MTINVLEHRKEHYEQGHLNYCLDNIAHHNTVEEWREYLQNEPIAYFTNTADYKLEEGVIKYEDEEGKHEYEVSLVITTQFTDYHIIHSATAPQSMFFLFNTLDDSLEMVYVD